MKNLLHTKLLFLLVLASLASATAIPVDPVLLGGNDTVTTSTIGGPIDYGLE